MKKAIPFGIWLAIFVLVSVSFSAEKPIEKTRPARIRIEAVQPPLNRQTEIFLRAFIVLFRQWEDQDIVFTAQLARLYKVGIFALAGPGKGVATIEIVITVLRSGDEYTILSGDVRRPVFVIEAVEKATSALIIGQDWSRGSRFTKSQPKP